MRSKDFKQLKESVKQMIAENKRYKLPPEELVIEHFNQVLDQLKPDNYKLTAKGVVGLIYNIIEDYNRGLK